MDTIEKSDEKLARKRKKKLNLRGATIKKKEWDKIHHPTITADTKYRDLPESFWRFFTRTDGQLYGNFQSPIRFFTRHGRVGVFIPVSQRHVIVCTVMILNFRTDL